MSNYTGIFCPVCEKRFFDGDDIVVCPSCGTPHHRTCYRQLGKCVHEAAHAHGYSWKTPTQGIPKNHTNVQQEAFEQENTSPQESILCPACGKKNPSSKHLCQDCGAPLKSAQPDFSQQASSQPYAWKNAQTVYKIPTQAYLALFGGLSPDDCIEDVPVREIALRVGAGSYYFLPRFKQISEHGGISINLSAFFFNFLYFFYRKMYLAGFILFGLFLIGISPAFFLFPEFFQFVSDHIEELMMGANLVFEPTRNLWALQLLPFARIFLFACGMLFSFLANRIYFHSVMRSIRKLKKDCTTAEKGFDELRYAHALRLCGGASILGPVVFIGAVLGSIYLFTMLMALSMMGG